MHMTANGGKQCKQKTATQPMCTAPKYAKTQRMHKGAKGGKLCKADCKINARGGHSAKQFGKTHKNQGTVRRTIPKTRETESMHQHL